jgi:peptidoglycan-associated lipoprotein
MRRHALVATAVLAIVWLTATPGPAFAASRYKAFVYPDRANPDLSVVIDDFRINETVWDSRGVQYVWVNGPAGHFQVPFSTIRQIEFLKYVGPNISKQDWAWYDVLVSSINAGETYTGRMEVRVMRGVAAGVPWYLYPMTEADRGRQLWRIVFGDSRVPPTIPWEAPKPAVAPAPPVALVVPRRAPAPPPSPPTEDDRFAKLSLADLNKQTPLDAVYFDFDKSDLRPDGEAALLRNAAWLKRWPSVKVRIDGCADPRGTNEYNISLGMRRADVVRALLVAQGVALERVDVLSIGASQLVCTEQTEACWARNRRGHFVITAK